MDEDLMDEDKPIVKPAIEAKQGIELHRMRYVLAFSLGGAIIIVGLITAFFPIHF